MTTTTRPPILYIGGTLPTRSETFVYREIFALREAGWIVHAASVHAPEHDLGDEALEHLADEAITIYAQGPLRLLLRAAGEWLRHPLSATGTVFTAMRAAVLEGELPLAKRPRIVWQALAALSAAHRVRERAVRHVHAHMAHVPTTIAMYLARHLRISFSFTGHAVDIFTERTLLEQKLRSAAFCACISEWHRSFYREFAGIETERLPVIRCGVDVTQFSPGRPPDDDLFHILGVGRLVPKKGFDTLIEAIGTMPDRYAHVRCTIVGSGPQRKRLEELRLRHDRRDQVELVGAKSNAEVRQLIRESHLFVLPCRVDDSGDQDGIPVVLMEAMACCVPVISGDIVTIRELIEHGESGLMVQGDAPAELRQAISALIVDPHARRAIAAAGRRRVEREFSQHVNIERLHRALCRAVRIDPDREPQAAAANEPIDQVRTA